MKVRRGELVISCRCSTMTSARGVSCSTLSWPRATIGDVDVTQADIDRIPSHNLRVRRAEFAAFWAAAERFHDDNVRNRVSDWYGAGVVMTCRWLARATVRPQSGPWRQAESPVTGRRASAYEELIEAECVAAEKLAMQRPVPPWLVNQPGWIDAVVATLNWAWRRSGQPPMTFDQPAAG